MIGLRTAVVALALSSVPAQATEIAACDPLRNAAARAAPDFDRIGNGTPAPAGAWPFNVALARGTGEPPGWIYCSGTLIARDWILTAGHCAVEEGDFAYVGFLRFGQAGGKRLIVKKSFHYGKPEDILTGGPDLQLLRVRGWKGKGTEFPRVRLGPPGDATEGCAFGWGRTETGAKPDRLMEVILPFVPTSECAAAYKAAQLDPVPARALCAGSAKYSVLSGDSGGPVLIATPQGFVQVGVASRHLGDLPGVFTRVDDALPWIEKTTGVRLSEPGDEQVPQ